MPSTAVAHAAGIRVGYGARIPRREDQYGEVTFTPTGFFQGNSTISYTVEDSYNLPYAGHLSNEADIAVGVGSFN